VGYIHTDIVVDFAEWFTIILDGEAETTSLVANNFLLPDSAMMLFGGYPVWPDERLGKQRSITMQTNNDKNCRIFQKIRYRRFFSLDRGVLVHSC
jgi:hypothetical protein